MKATRFIVALTAVLGAMSIGTGSSSAGDLAPCTDDPVINTLGPLDAPSVIEGASGQTTIVDVVVQLSCVSPKTTTADYEVTTHPLDASSETGRKPERVPADPFADFIPQFGTLAFAPGETEKTISVAILGDNIDEDTQWVWVGLGNPVNASVGFARKFIPIDDDDPAPHLLVSNPTVTESDGAAPFTFSLSGPSEKPVLIFFNTRTITAVSPDDFTGSGGSISLGKGIARATVYIPLTDDAIAEPTEQFEVDYSSSLGKAYIDSVVIDPPATAIATIVDDD